MKYQLGDLLGQRGESWTAERPMYVVAQDTHKFKGELYAKCLDDHFDVKLLGHENAFKKIGHKDDVLVSQGMRYYWDGNKICCVHDKYFENLQVSPAGFGDTLDEATANFVEDCAKHLRKSHQSEETK